MRILTIWLTDKVNQELELMMILNICKCIIVKHLSANQTIQDASFITSETSIWNLCRNQLHYHLKCINILTVFEVLTKYWRSIFLYHDNAARITTSATGINIGGAIDAVTSITGSGDITIATDKFTLDSATGDAVFGGNITGGGDLNATTGTTFQLGSTSSAKLGIGRAAATYNLEVEGSIYSTGSTIIAGNGSAGKFILQKGAAAISMNFTNSVGTDEVIIDASGRFGVGKTPSKKWMFLVMQTLMVTSPLSQPILHSIQVVKYLQENLFSQILPLVQQPH